ncbi:hypothetical protein TNCV_4387551 [Trichonephila clavipes]|nr:hypothetical protein TNCV_4387551 [Trichonephila clavipes]
MTRERVENREGSLGYPRFVRPVFTKDSKPIGKRKRSLRYLGIVKPVLTWRRKTVADGVRSLKRELPCLLRFHWSKPIDAESGCGNGF